MPTGIALDTAGNIYFSDVNNGRLRVLVPNTPAVAPLSIVTASLPGGMTGTPYSQLLSATGGGPPYQWAQAVGSLPAGLTLSPAGLISGIPTSAGTFNFSAQLTDAAGSTASANLTIVISAPLSITTASTLLAGIVGAPYSQAVSPAGGQGPYIWSVASGSLPYGLALSSAGLITGIPAVAGTSTFMLEVMDAASSSSTLTFSITVISGAGYTINTFAGTGKISSPEGLAVDAQGNVYIADSGSNVVWMASPAGVLTVFAGSGTAGYSGDGGAAGAAMLNAPHGVAVDSNSNLFIADSANNCIREVTAGGVIQTVASGLNGPYGLAFDAAGDLFVTESAGNRVRVLSNGSLQTVSADPLLQMPYGLTVDASGNLFIADGADNAVLQYQSGVLKAIDGAGTAGSGPDQLSQPRGVAVDPSGNLYIADTENSRILELTASGALVQIAGTVIAGYSGDGGPSSAAAIARPTGIALDGNGNIYFSDHDNGVVRILKRQP
jgi:sugar lactone lactonase YvrE